MTKLLALFPSDLGLFLGLPAQAQDYRIQPGDTLQLDVLEDGSLSRPLLVLPDGTVAVPSGGVVKTAGLTLPQAQAAVTAALAPNFAKPPTVYLSVGQISPAAQAAAGAATGSGASVYIMGEVAHPGRAPLASGTTLLQLLAETGGLTPFAATKRIQLRRTGADGKEQVYLFDYAAVLRGEPARNLTLKRGDIIIVPTKRLFE